MINRNASRLVLRRLAGALPLLFGVTLLSFMMTVYFGPDKSWELAGRNPTPAELEQIREQLGYDRPFVVRYADFVMHMIRLDFGYSETTGERVDRMLTRTLPVSLMLLLPGFVLGTLLALALAMLAAWYRGRWLDRLVTGFSVFGMSLSFVVVIIAFQAIFCVWLGWFPVRGWVVESPADYFLHATVPTLATIFVGLGYNTRFFRTVLVNELCSGHVLVARAYGVGPFRLMTTHVLGNSMLPIMTRIIYSVPFIIISGSLLIESHFSIPGVGRITYEAILSGDQPILMAVVTLSSVLFVIAATLGDLLSRTADPRLALR